MLRSRCFAMLELTQKLHERYHALIRQTAPEGMRPPTINEVRRFDRELMKQALKFKAEGQGDLSHCLEYDLDSPSSGLWRLLDVVPENLPDFSARRKTLEIIRPRRTVSPRGLQRWEGNAVELGVAWFANIRLAKVWM